MAIRFNRRIRIAPGVRLNVGKSGTSVSVGKPGASVNIGKDGVRGNAGIPGTGLSASHQIHKTAPKARTEGSAGQTAFKALAIFGFMAAILAAFSKRR
jgi:hypothetical protein